MPLHIGAPPHAGQGHSGFKELIDSFGTCSFQSSSRNGVAVINPHRPLQVAVHLAHVHSVVKQVENDGGGGIVCVVKHILNIVGQVFSWTFHQLLAADGRVHHLRVDGADRVSQTARLAPTPQDKCAAYADLRGMQQPVNIRTVADLRGMQQPVNIRTDADLRGMQQPVNIRTDADLRGMQQPVNIRTEIQLQGKLTV